MDVRPRRRFAKMLTLGLFVSAAGCTWLVKFDTESPDCTAAECADASMNPDVPFTQADTGTGTFDAPKGDTGTAPVDSMVPFDVPPPPPDSTVAQDSTVADTMTMPESSTTMDSAPPAPCAGKPDGTQWDVLDPNARCCGGAAVETTSNTNCGVCGIVCNTGAGQTCSVLDNEYLCTGCQANADCWSGCCATTGGNHCAATDCSTGMCQVPDVCAQFGATCVIAEVGYCSY